ncbi:MFS transporter [Candidatus Sumerlaeota bacterium]|nr:MFS transporter [Candidatus Sumerlaeota bacterium]
MQSCEKSKPLGSFGWFNATQFLGALNDNIYQLLIIFLLIKIQGKENASSITATAGAVFVIPFLLFSHAGGVLADRFSKSKITFWIKIIEILVMTLGGIAFLSKSPLALYATLFLMTTQSAFFGPAKYSIIPELVDRSELSKANSILVSFTYLAIILGVSAAGGLSWVFRDFFAASAIVCILIAIAGTWCSLKIRKTPPCGVKGRLDQYLPIEIIENIRDLKKDSYLFLTVIGSAYFLLIGSFCKLNVIPYGIERLKISEEASSQFFLLAAFGIGFGSYLAGRLSGRQIEFGVVPIGALGLTITNLLLNMIPPNLVLVGVIVFIMGTSAGLFIVPLNSYIQFRTPKEIMGKILATKNFLDFVGVLIAAGLLYLMSQVFHFTPGRGFLAMGLLTLILTIITLIILPDFLLRFVAVVVMRLGYRIRIHGQENIPIEGPALLICNHVSWVDALLLMATQQRRIRFLMYREIYESRLLKPLFKLMGVIPISFRDSPKKMLQSLKQARAAMDEGYMACIFAEGSVTRTGNMLGFRRGFERIVKGSDYPIIPIYLGGAWGSILSYYHGKLLSRFPSLIPYKITVIFGKPMPPSSTALEVRIAVQELSTQAFNLQKPSRMSLARMFVLSAKKNWFRFAMNDTLGRNLTYGKCLTAAVMLKTELKRWIKDENKVGIVMPASVPGALVNIALTMMGKIPVNLNFTAPESSVRSAIEQAGIKTVLTSRKFLEKYRDFRIPEETQTLYLEDLFAKIRTPQKISALLKAFFLPSFILTPAFRFKADDPATIIFSSGTTGEPKGVALSHHNIISNIEQMRMILHFSPKDNVCGALPFFHSFGYTVTLWLPLVSGFSVSYHPNPLDGAMIADLVRRNKSTMLLGTPTFLQMYMRKASPEDFKTLKWVVSGAEKLRKPISDAFERKFGIRPLEGYGATELSPVAAFNVPDVELGGVHQVGTKINSVGHPLPGISVKIIDPDSGRLLPMGEPGLLLVKGPNVMIGYLGKPDKTSEVLQDGWYNTGDIARMDEDGFITITDRISRFSKIGGEMVPHLAIEEEYLRGLGATEQVIAVTSIPDEKKGEKLVVLFTDQAGPLENLKTIMDQSAIPNLWKPHPDSYFKIDQIPLLGTGKVDLKGLKSLALQAAGTQ